MTPSLGYSTPWISGVAKMVITQIENSTTLAIKFFGANGETCRAFHVLPADESGIIEVIDERNATAENSDGR